MAVYFGEKIKAARKAVGMTQKQLAEKIGVANTTVSNWEKNANRPDPDQIELLCGLLNIAPSILFGEKESELIIPPGFEPMPKMATVPRVGAIACGDPILAEQNIEDYDKVPADWHADFTLVCEGDSMMPRIQDGDVVAIRRTPSVENGEIAAVRIGDEATLKHIYLHADYIELRPENPAFPSIIRRRNEMNDVHIEGKAVGLCRSL
ncbi:MAG: helix-turn-helix domain-containing protein [Ruminococcus bromii]|nr:helix-turn-helix domain-containing protein [Ruminococcus bromii]